MSVPYIGSRISLISQSEMRYEGILENVNITDSTLTLQNVKSFGSENRKHPMIAPSNEIYESIEFRGRDIKELVILDYILSDPAIISISTGPQPQHSPSFPQPQQGYWDSNGDGYAHTTEWSQECADIFSTEFDFQSSNKTFAELPKHESARPLGNYNKNTSFFDTISCGFDHADRCKPRYMENNYNSFGGSDYGQWGKGKGRSYF